MATGSSSQACLGDAGRAPHGFRNTDEYAAAFDLEVWKAQQQARFRSQLRQAKEKLERRIYAELQERDRRQIDELDRTRAELEQMAEKIEAAGEALQKRQAQLEAREAAFDARRVRVAEQHETHLSRVEQRARRAVEESAATIEGLRAQIRERDLTVQQLQERLHCAQSEYDMLQRRTARHMSGLGGAESGGDPVSLRELQARLKQAEGTIQTLEGQLRQHITLVDRLSHDHDVLLREHHECQLEIHTLRRDKAALLARTAADTAVTLEPTARPRSRRSAAVKSPDAASDRAGGDLLMHMLHDLRRDITRHVNQSDAGRRDTLASQAAGLVCETGSPPPLDRSRAVGDAGNPRPATGGAYVVAEEVGGIKAAGTAPAAAPTPRGNATQPAKAPQHGNGEPQRTPTVRFQEPNRLDSSAETDRYAYVTRPIPEGDGIYPDFHRDESDPDIERCEEVGRRGGELPPLAPAATVSAITPSPEEFAQAATVPSYDAGTTRLEMSNFVQMLKMNRERLLQTGVYTIDSPIVKEMSEKIVMYEEYLSKC